MGLILPSSITAMATHTPMEATEPMAMDTLMACIMACTTERGLLMLSPRPRLILPSSMAPMAMATTHSAMDTDMGMPDTLMLTMVTTTARGPLMPTTATTAMVPGPTTATTVWDTTVWATGDP